MADPRGAFGRRALLKGGAGLVAGRFVGAGLLSGIAHAAPSPVPAPDMITRAQWGADESLGDRRRSFATITKSVVHHTATDDQGSASVQAIHRFHTQSRGWSDIGYNFLVDSVGTIYEGRWARDYLPGEDHTGEDLHGRGVIGAHAGGFNTRSVGIALLGDTSLTAVNDTSLTSIARIIAWKFGPRDLDPYGSSPYRRTNGTTVTFPNICGHKDVISTGCPGTGLYARLPELRDRVYDLVNRGLVGFRILGADGSLWTYGASSTFSRTADIGDVRRDVRHGIPVRAVAATPTGYGAWVADVNGSVYTFGDAPFAGSMGGVRLNRPIVGLAGTPSGRGYWLCATDGGMFSFGDARFFGSTGDIRLNQPIVGMTSTPSGRGYWLVASDGGIFTFGDARFFGSTGGIRLAQPIVGMAAAPDGLGYWLVARDGGIFSFGTAPFLGSAVGRVTGQATGMAVNPNGRGYWVLDAAGGVHGFGDAPHFGSGVTEGSRPALGLVPIFRQ
jgi:hypothetical protein